MRALKTQIGAGLSNPGGPSKSDTTRLVQASEAQLVELLRQGYVLEESELIRSTRRITENDYYYRAVAANKVDDLMAEDLITALKNQPELLAVTQHSPLDYLGYFYLTPDQLNEVADIIESTLDEVASGGLFNRHSAGETGVDRSPEEQVRRIEGRIKSIRDVAVKTAEMEASLDTDDNLSIRRVNNYRRDGQGMLGIMNNITRFFGRLVLDHEDLTLHSQWSPIGRITDPNLIAQREKAKTNAMLGRMSQKRVEVEEIDEEHEAITDQYRIRTDLTMIKVLNDANPDSELDYDLYEKAVKQGYDNQAMDFVAESYTLANMANAFENVAGAISDWWTDDTEYEEVDMGDKGVQQRVTQRRTTETTTPGLDQIGGTVSIRGFYPQRRVTETIENIEGYRDDTDYREDLEDGFYLDREDEGTGAVRREDLDKTLFHEDVFPGKKLTLWNEEEKDMVSVYVYDKPEMLKKSGIRAYESVVGQLEDGKDVGQIIDQYDTRVGGGTQTEGDEDSQVVINRQIEPIPPVVGDRTERNRVERRPPEVPQKPPGLTPIKKKQAGPIAMTGRGGLMKPKTSMPRGQKQSYGMRMANPTKFQGGQLEQTKFVGGKEQKMTIEEAAHHVYKRGKRRFNSNPEIGLREATREAINLGKKGLMNVDLSDAKDYPDNFLSISL